MENLALRWFYSLERSPVPIERRLGGPKIVLSILESGKFLAPIGIRTADRLAPS